MFVATLWQKNIYEQKANLLDEFTYILFSFNPPRLAIQIFQFVTRKVKSKPCIEQNMRMLKLTSFLIPKLATVSLSEPLL